MAKLVHFIHNYQKRHSDAGLDYCKAFKAFRDKEDEKVNDARR